MSYVLSELRLARLCREKFIFSEDDFRELSFYAHKRANDNTIPAEKRVVFERQGDYLLDLALRKENNL